jgi:hypothetical protein
LLGFSINEREVLPSTNSESQYLQIVRFSAGLCRICTFNETSLMSAMALRDVFEIALRCFSVSAEALCPALHVDEASGMAFAQLVK